MEEGGERRGNNLPHSALVQIPPKFCETHGTLYRRGTLEITQYKSFILKIRR